MNKVNKINEIMNKAKNNKVLSADSPELPEKLVKDKRGWIRNEKGHPLKKEVIAQLKADGYISEKGNILITYPLQAFQENRRAGKVKDETPAVAKRRYSPESAPSAREKQHPAALPLKRDDAPAAPIGAEKQRILRKDDKDRIANTLSRRRTQDALDTEIADKIENLPPKLKNKIPAQIITSDVASPENGNMKRYEIRFWDKNIKLPDRISLYISAENADKAQKRAKEFLEKIADAGIVAL